jgi:6-phosphogluconolactonase (cycloisomerase 2 family)
MIKWLFWLTFCSIAFCAKAQIEKTYLFVGSYTEGKPDTGIYVFEFLPNSGEFIPVSQVAEIINPSFLHISKSGQYLYACTETKLPNEGSVSAFQFDANAGTLKRLNSQKSGGVNPVYVTTDSSNRFLVNANYTDGSVSVFPIAEDGSLNSFVQRIGFEGSGLHQNRQERAHIHAAVFSPDQQYLYFPDLGSDKIHVFGFHPSEEQPLQAKEQLTYTALPGSGPRHFTFHPNGRFTYCIDELSGTVTAFNYYNGKLDSIQRLRSYSKFQEVYNSADIHISSDGLFVYASNRWDEENTISIFAIDTQTGKLELRGHQSTYGDHPRNFTLDPSGKFLIVANQVTHNLVVFKRDLQTGLLTPTGFEVHVPNPSCLQMRTYSVSNN